MLEQESREHLLAPGTQLGKYRLVRHLGSGGMGSVYEGIHVDIGKRVAIKTLNPEIAAMPGARARFLREAQLTSRVRHPHIVDVTDVGNDQGHAYLVMELLAGEDLASRLTRGGMMSVDALADVLIPICAAIDAAHASGVIHRDLKPQNIFLTQSVSGLVPKVLDFGISKNRDLAASALTSTGAIVGTPYYLPPELVRDGRAASAATDQYALGVILYECLTARRPYDGPTIFAIFQSVVAGSPLPVRQLRPDVPPALEQIIARAMAIDPAARFESVRHLARALVVYCSAPIRYQWEGLLLMPPAASMPTTELDGLWDPSESDSGGGFGRAPSTPLPPTPYAPFAPHPAFGGTTPLPPYSPSPSNRGQETKALLPGDFPGDFPGASGRSQGEPGTHPGRSDEFQRGRTPRPSGRRVPSEISWPPGSHHLDEPSRWPWVVGGLLILAGGVAAAYFMWMRPEPPRPRPRETAVVREAERPSSDPGRVTSPPQPRVRMARFDLEVDPSEATIEIDGRTLGHGRISTELQLGQESHMLRVSASGFDDREIAFSDSLPPSHLSLTRSAIVVPQPTTNPRPEPRPSDRHPDPRPRPRPRPRPGSGQDDVPLIE